MSDLNPLIGELERYWQPWKFGKGALKIRWGTTGDWTRCHRNLAKHVGPERAARICQTWHKEMTGVYTGDRRNI